MLQTSAQTSDYRAGQPVLEAPFLLASALALGTFFLAQEPAQAQKQVQVARVSVPVGVDGAPKAFLDSVHTFLGSQKSGKSASLVSRRPSDSTVSLSKLEQSIRNEYGFTSGLPSRVVITYRFNLAGQGFRERILSLQYLFTPPGVKEEVDLIFLSAQNQKWVREQLREKSGLSRTAYRSVPFSAVLSFLRLSRIDDAEILQVGGEEVSKQQGEQFMERVNQAAGGPR